MYDTADVEFALNELLIVQIAPKNIKPEKQFSGQTAGSGKCNKARATLIVRDFFYSCNYNQVCKFFVWPEDMEDEGCPTMSASNALFLKASCTTNNIQFPKLKTQVDRETITWVIVICDVLICLVFAANAYIMEWQIAKQAQDYDRQGVQLTDFAIRIRHLPETDDIDLLAAELEHYIREQLQNIAQNNSD